VSKEDDGGQGEQRCFYRRMWVGSWTWRRLKSYQQVTGWEVLGGNWVLGAKRLLGPYSTVQLCILAKGQKIDEQKSTNKSHESWVSFILFYSVKSCFWGLINFCHIYNDSRIKLSCFLLQWFSVSFLRWCH
jgi:hypothetical protein